MPSGNPASCFSFLRTGLPLASQVASCQMFAKEEQGKTASLQGCQMAVFAANLAIFGRMAMPMATKKIKWPEGRKDFKLAMKNLRGFFTK